MDPINRQANNNAKNPKRGKAKQPVVVKITTPKNLERNTQHALKVRASTIQPALKKGVAQRDMEVHAAEEYAKCLVSPYDHATRVPTAYNNLSSLLRTRRTFDVLVSHLGANKREFAFFVQPKLGDPSTPKGFQIGLVDFSKNPVDLTVPSGYQLFDGSGVSLPLDPNAPYITQAPPSALGWQKPDNITQTDPLADVQPLIINGEKFTYGIDPIQPVANPAAQLGSLLTVPAGSYLLTIKTTTGATSTNASPLGISVIAGNGSDSNVGFVKNIMLDVPGHTTQANSWALNVTEFDKIRIVKAATEASVINSIQLMLVPLCSPAITWSSNYGLTEEIRPVGMSVLTTCVVQAMNAGGTIQSALLAGSSSDKVFDGSWLGPTGLNSIQGYFAGNFKEGNYMWWRPYSPADIQFKSVENANKYEYPMFLVRGSPTVPSDATPETVVARVTVEFVYEITQNSQLLERKELVGSTELYESALRAVKGLPYASENPKHSSLLKQVNSVLDTGAKFLPFLSAMFGAY